MHKTFITMRILKILDNLYIFDDTKENTGI